MDKLKLAQRNRHQSNCFIEGISNSGIRETLKEAENKYKWKTFVPKFEYTTDNAAMIGCRLSKFLSQNFETCSRLKQEYNFKLYNYYNPNITGKQNLFFR
jgi:N6-L-threonylcarbamoyladenine synthase